MRVWRCRPTLSCFRGAFTSSSSPSSAAPTSLGLQVEPSLLQDRDRAAHLHPGPPACVAVSRPPDHPPAHFLPNSLCLDMILQLDPGSTTSFLVCGGSPWELCCLQGLLVKSKCLWTFFFPSTSLIHS